ncbi:PspC domain-containing protein [Trueperella sp.]|uniref:PspC domain-containing protein n=1 Tax=Trueperella sp. TaxID=2699835 RepID=UPI0037355DD9
MNIYNSMRSAPLRRTPDRLLGGVCAGLAHRWGIAPALVRILAVLLFLVFGLGLLLYGLAWLFIPEYETEDVLAERAQRDPDVSVATAVAMTLIGFVGAVLTLATFFGNISRTWWQITFNFVVIGVVLLLLYVIVRWIRRRRGKRSVHSAVGESSYGGETGPGGETGSRTVPASQPRRVRKPRVSTPAISGRAARLVVALAIAGLALALVVVDGRLARILMALSIALAILSIGVFVAGIKGLRATWLTALTWLVGIPTVLGLLVSLALPSRFITAEDLKFLNLGGKDGVPSLMYVTEREPAETFEETLPTAVDTFFLGTGASRVPEDVAVIYRLTRDSNTFGYANVMHAGIREWKVVQGGVETATAAADPIVTEEGYDLAYFTESFHVLPGQTLELHSPAAIENPDDARVVDIHFYYGELTVVGASPQGVTDEEWVEASASSGDDDPSDQDGSEATPSPAASTPDATQPDETQPDATQTEGN